MITAFLEGPDLLVVLAIGLLLFGGTKLPQLARSLGEAKRELDKGMKGESDATTTTTTNATAVPPIDATTPQPPTDKLS